MDGTSWEELPLAAATGSTLSAVAAGPEGVVVIGTDDDDPETVKIWHATKGRQFDTPLINPVRYYSDTPTAPLSADSDGFLLVCGVGTTVAYTSNNGIDWRDISPGLEKVDWLGPAARYGSTWASFGYVSDGGPGSDETPDPDNPFGVGVWTRGDDGQNWSRSSKLDPGRLPDAGVAPPVNAHVQSVAVSDTAFIVAGNADYVGAVWTSPDGQVWTKQPTRANGFDKIFQFDAVAASGSRVVLVGYGPIKTNVWLGQVTLVSK
ncbi:hypothetical protein [Micromonospora sp. DPT]|uniref:hypothetical protein n=1 Tax=Micromonospora sp. DPT TaxID=3142975 RepID=UPI0032083CCB